MSLDFTPPQHRCCVFGEFASLKSTNRRLYGAIQEHHSVVLQLFKVEATRLGFTGSTDLQTHVPVHLSFVYLTAVKSKAKSEAMTMHLDNNFFVNGYILCRLLL